MGCLHCRPTRPLERLNRYTHIVRGSFLRRSADEWQKPPSLRFGQTVNFLPSINRLKEAARSGRSFPAMEAHSRRAVKYRELLSRERPAHPLNAGLPEENSNEFRKRQICHFRNSKNLYLQPSIEDLFTAGPIGCLFKTPAAHRPAHKPGLVKLIGNQVARSESNTTVHRLYQQGHQEGFVWSIEIKQRRCGFPQHVRQPAGRREFP